MAVALAVAAVSTHSMALRCGIQSMAAVLDINYALLGLL
jgi:hypothetical protein